MFQNKIMNKKLFSFAVTALAAAMLFTACENKKAADKPAENTPAAVNDAPPTPPAEPAPAAKTVVDIAVGSADHTTLVAAVKAADLVTTLSGAGPFTVFAPTNAAFAKIDKATLDALMTPEKKADLASILTYHVVPGSVKAADLKDGQMVKTVNGKELKVTIKDGKVMIDGANVTAADLTGSNGVVHVIDAVVMPKK
jgi:uncharacterized surface protein with fasciclin (FAS1) repeats